MSESIISVEGDSQEVYDDVAAVDPDDVGAGEGEAGKLTSFTQRVGVGGSESCITVKVILKKCMMM